MRFLSTLMLKLGLILLACCLAPKALQAQQEQVPPQDLPDSLRIAMVFVQGGTFTMGCTKEQGDNCLEDEKPSRQVTLDDYYIGRYEVTQAQWRYIMGRNPSKFRGCWSCPVENVSWFDVQKFISKLNERTGQTYRLPTEAEWEFAARGGTKSRGYRYAGANYLDTLAWYYGNSGNRTHSVGRTLPNELGIFDMTGNVFEWCADWFGPYPPYNQNNHKGASAGPDRVLRGGSYDAYPWACRVSYRRDASPVSRTADQGFRLVWVKPQEPKQEQSQEREETQD